jgi:hypothetical protein
MPNIEDSLPSNHYQCRLMSPKSNQAETMQHAHVTSSASTAREQIYTISPEHHERYRILSTAPLNNRNLLVPTRLALKRQRATMKGLSLHNQSTRSAIFQMELGHNQDVEGQYDSPDRFLSRQTTSINGKTNGSSPTNITLAYR